MIIEIFIIYMIVVLVTVLIKAIGKIGQDFSSYNSNETLREQWRKRIETPPFPLKCCISIAYKVKKRVVPYLYRFLEPLQTIS